METDRMKERQEVENLILESNRDSVLNICCKSSNTKLVRQKSCYLSTSKSER